jgi:hypothetical protein
MPVARSSLSGHKTRPTTGRGRGPRMRLIFDNNRPRPSRACAFDPSVRTVDGWIEMEMTPFSSMIFKYRLWSCGVRRLLIVLLAP